MTDHARNGAGFRHEAFFYGDGDEFLATTQPFVEEGLAAGEAILVALPEPNRRLLRGALGSAGEGVRFAVMEDLGRNPARIISAWHDFLDAATRTGSGARGIGEPIWAARPLEELDECHRHELLLNAAFEGGPSWTLMCPYDVNSLDDDVLAGAERNHPVHSGRRNGSASDGALPDPAVIFEGSLEQPAGAPFEMAFERHEISEVRRRIAEHARDAGLGAERTDDLVLAACEIATNSVRWAGGAGRLRIWSDGEALTCDIRDSGRIEKPLVGRRRPDRDQVGGRGVWIANQLCDLVQIRSGEDGTHVRLRMDVGRETGSGVAEDLVEGAAAEHRAG
jgi:anti-sigma regulatory factor (Ser/Thr protein kinase)